MAKIEDKVLSGKKLLEVDGKDKTSFMLYEISMNVMNFLLW